MAEQEIDMTALTLAVGRGVFDHDPVARARACAVLDVASMVFGEGPLGGVEEVAQSCRDLAEAIDSGAVPAPGTGDLDEGLAALDAYYRSKSA